MKLETQIGGEIEVIENSYLLIALFMRWFLRKERLEQDTQLRKWIETLDEFEGEDLDSWGDFVRQAVLEAVLPHLRAILERPLTMPERFYLGACVERFIESYKKGSGRMLPLKTMEGDHRVIPAK